MRDGDDAKRVDGVGLEVLLERDVGERPAEDDAGVVDQHVDRTGLVADLVAQGDDARRVGDVDTDDV